MMVTAVIAGVLDLADSMIVMYTLLSGCVCKDSGPGIKKKYLYMHTWVMHS